MGFGQGIPEQVYRILDGQSRIPIHVACRSNQMASYHLCMQVRNVFGHVCQSVCLSVFLSVQAITLEPLDIETSFLVCSYILTITRSSLSIKVTGSRSRSYKKK